MQDELRSEGIPFSMMMALVEDVDYTRPPEDPTLAAEYAEYVEVDRAFPIGADLAGLVTESVPEEYGWYIPAKCAVSREMVILGCSGDFGIEDMLEAVRADWGE